MHRSLDDVQAVHRAQVMALPTRGRLSTIARRRRRGSKTWSDNGFLGLTP
jgi:hypothetical protein